MFAGVAFISFEEELSNLFQSKANF